MRLIELHEEQGWQRERIVRLAQDFRFLEIAKAKDVIAHAEQEVQRRLGKAGIGWTSLAYWVPDAERIYRPLWWLHAGHAKPIPGCRLCREGAARG